MHIHLCALQVYLHCTILVLIKFSSISCIFDAGSIVCSVLSSLVKPVCSTFDLRTLHILSCLSPFHSFHSSSVPTWILYVLLMVCLSLLFGLLNQVFYTMSSWKDSLWWGEGRFCVRCAIHDSVDFPKDRGESFTSHAFLLSWGNSCASSSRLHSIFPMYLFPRFFPLGVNHLLSLGLSLMQHCPSDYVPSTFRVHSPFLPLLVYSSVPQWIPHEFTIRKPCVPAQVPS